MKRQLGRLTEDAHDLLVVGGGINGVAIAWDAAQRGLRVALVEAKDFCSGVSWNSLKTIHGGIRHLQRADIAGVRESVRERRALLRIAPEIVAPLPFLIPTYGHGLKGREAMAVGLLLNDLIGFDRNAGLSAERQLPRGRLLTAAAVRELVPGVPTQGLSGGAVWTDAQAQSSERLVLGFLHSAAGAGAVLANHLPVTALITSGSQVAGVRAFDSLADQSLEIRARLVVNAAGRGFEPILSGAGLEAARVPLLQATNLVLRRKPPSPLAVGMAIRGRYLFMVPWGEHTIVGTAYDPEDAGQQALEAFLADARRAFFWLGLEAEEVSLVHRGLVPGRGGETGLWAHHRIVDHHSAHGLSGLMSIVGVKYTTARRVAEVVVDRVVQRLGVSAAPCRTAVTPLEGVLPPAGTLEERAGWAVEEEMACSLADAVLRRLDLGTAGPPQAADLDAVGRAMAARLGWNETELRDQVARVDEAYSLARVLGSG